MFTDRYELPTQPILAVALVITLIVLWRKKPSLSYLLCLGVFSVYLLFALDKAFFPIAISGYYVDEMRKVPFSSAINLIPFNFNFDLSEMPELVYMQIFQNMLLTVPFGFGLSFVAPVKAKDFRWIIPAVGLGIEGTQLIIALLLRYPYRVIDINDAILNALGVLIGYVIFRIFAWLYVKAIERLGIKPRGLAGYIDEVGRGETVLHPSGDTNY